MAFKLSYTVLTTARAENFQRIHVYCAVFSMFTLHIMALFVDMGYGSFSFSLLFY